MSTTHAQESLRADESLWQDNYAQILTEQLLDSGRAQFLRGEYTAAEQTFSEAQHIAKINHGLNTELQIPALQLVIESIVPQGRWQSLNRQLAHFEWLNSIALGKDLELYLNGVEVLSDLYLMAAATPGIPNPAHYLITAKNLNWRAVSELEAAFGRDSVRLSPWLYRIVLTHFYQSSLIYRSGMTSYDYKTATPAVISGWSLRKNESLSKSYNIGAELLQRIRTIHTEADSENTQAEAMLLTYLGDWELFFANGESAFQYYQQAASILTEAGYPLQSVDNLFGRPAIIPRNRLELKLPTIAANDATQAIRFVAWSSKFPGAARPESRLSASAETNPPLKTFAVFDIVAATSDTDSPGDQSSGAGFTISNLQISNTTPDSESTRQQALREISALHMRPRIVDGRAQPSAGVLLEYLFSEEEAAIYQSDP